MLQLVSLTIGAVALGCAGGKLDGPQLKRWGDTLEISNIHKADLEEIRGRPLSRSPSVSRNLPQVEHREAPGKAGRSARALQSCANVTTATRVDLSNCGLTGLLASQLLSLGNLSQANYMDLSGNAFSGPIPSWLGNYSRLSFLSLSSNQLTGSIPASLGSLSRLATLDLSSNQLSGVIPDALGRLSSLAVLHLEYNKLTGTLPKSFNQLSQLRMLWLGANQLSGPVPEVLASLPLMSRLELFRNQFTGPIPVWLGTLTSLVFLDLGENKLQGTIPECLSRLTSLQELWLHQNLLEGVIPSFLGSLSQLRLLDLDSNQLVGIIPEALSALSQLSRLFLYNNRLTGSIPPWLCQMQSLYKLFLNGNQLTGSIPPCVGNLSDLVSLDLSGNYLTGEIPASIANLSNLYGLWLNLNQLGGIIPQKLGQLQQLKWLDLSQNQLSGPIPPQLGNSSQLLRLSLQSNQLSGQLPLSLNQLTLLDFLNISSNNLSGTVDLSASSATTLVLANNQLTGVSGLPQELKSLDLSRNQLRGRIPPAILRQATLKVLLLSENPLSTQVPADLRSLPQLVELRLRACNISGSLPAEILSLPNLTTFDVQDNPLLTGTFPDSTASSLTTLLAKNCSFTAAESFPTSAASIDFTGNLLEAVPPNLGLLPNLRSLRLAKNRISRWPSFGVFGQSSLQFEGTQSQVIVYTSQPAVPPLNMQQLSTVDLANNPLRAPAREVISSLLYLPNLQYFSCEGCELFGSAATFFWVYYDGFWAGARPPLGFQSQVVMQGFANLLTLNLANNNITDLPTSVPPQLQAADLSNNLLSAGGLSRAWFNEDGTQPLTSLWLHGNSGLRSSVQAPQWGPDGGCRDLQQLTAKATGFTVNDNSTECTVLCPVGMVIYTSDYFLDPEDLCRCQAGHQGTALNCTGCPENTYSYADAEDIFQMTKVCQPCPPGSSTTGLVNLSSPCFCQCPIGTYLSAGIWCPEPSEQSSSLANVTCLRCPDLKTTAGKGKLSLTDCICDGTGIPGLLQAPDEQGSCMCPLGSYMNWKERACRECKEGENCGNWTTIVASSSSNKSRLLDPPFLLPGYWALTAGAPRDNFAGHSVYRCVSSDTCIDALGTCAKGREGRACGLCQPGYFGSSRGSCFPCQLSQTATRLSLAAALFLVWPAVVFLHVMNEFMLGAAQSAAVQPEAANPGPRSSAESSTLCEPAEQVANIHLLARKVWFATMYTAFFQLFQHAQLMSIITGVELSLPPRSGLFLDRVAQATLSGFQLIGVACTSNQQSAGLELGLRWAFPFVAVVLALVSPPFAWFVGKLLCWFGRSSCLASVSLHLGACGGREPLPLGAPFEDLGQKCLSLDLPAVLKVIARSCSSYFLNILVSSGLLLLTCLPNPNGHYTVQSFPHVECPTGLSTDTQEFLQLLGPCLAYGFVFVLVVPVAVNVFVFQQVVREMARTGGQGRGSWSNFCGRFRDSHVHWLLVLLGKDLMVNFLVTGLAALPYHRRLLLTVLVSCYGLWSWSEKPFRHLLNNVIEVLTSLSLASIVLVLGFSMESSWQDALLVLVVSSSLGCPVLLLAMQGLGTFARTSWLVPRALHPRTRAWKEERCSNIALGLARMGEALGGHRPVLERLDEIELHVLDLHLRSCAGLVAVTCAALLKVGSANATVSRLSSLHNEKLNSDQDSVAGLSTGVVPCVQEPTPTRVMVVGGAREETRASVASISRGVVPSVQESEPVRATTVGKSSKETRAPALPGSANREEDLVLEDMDF